MLTLKEIEKSCSGLTTNHNLVWVNAKCEKCGAQLRLYNSLVLPTYPPQYKYFCSKCDHVEIAFIKLPESKQARENEPQSELMAYNLKTEEYYWKQNSAATLRGNVVSIVGNSQEQVIPTTSI